MSEITTLEGELQYTEGSFAIVCARFNSFIVDSLESGAIDALKRHGVPEDSITLVKVPGAYEMPRLFSNWRKVVNTMPLLGWGRLFEVQRRILILLQVKPQKAWPM